MNYNLPEELAPLTGMKCFLYLLLYSIPLIGTIFMICHAIGAKNQNKRSLARGYFFILLLGIAVVGGEIS